MRLKVIVLLILIALAALAAGCGNKVYSGKGENVNGAEKGGIADTGKGRSNSGILPENDTNVTNVTKDLREIEEMLKELEKLNNISFEV